MKKLNERGVTLLEVIAGIAILSISSIILFSSFGTIIHFISNANELKNTSNDLLQVIEGNTSLGETKMKSQDASYQIVVDNRTIDVSSSINTYYKPKDNSIDLKTFGLKRMELLGETDNYIKEMDYMDSLVNDISKYEKQFANFFELLGGNPVVTNIFNANGSWKEFDKSLLPSSMRSSGPYYIRIVYPWTLYSVSSSTYPPVKGTALIYLSKYNERYSSSELFMENIHIIYDTNEKRWIYYPGNDIEIDLNLSFGIDCADHKGQGKGYKGELPIYINGIQQYVNIDSDINEYSAFKSYLSDEGGGYYVLDKSVPYDPDDPNSIDDCWQRVLS